MSEIINDKGKKPEDYGFHKREKENFGLQLHDQAKVKKIIGILSGKGGVGKSFVTAMLASGMQKKGYRTAVLDGDITGPSQGRIFGITSKAEGQKGMMFPAVTKTGVQIMSTNMLLDMDVQPVIWRGPMVANVLKQFYSEVLWEDVDYMFVDLPPGTGDIQLTLSQKIPVTGSVVVTTPQDIALIDARKAVDMFNKVNISILGVLENMSVHVCSNCGHHEALFGSDGGKNLAAKLNVPLLGQLPLSLPVREAMDAGTAGALLDNQPAVAEIYTQAAFQIVLAVADKGRDFSSKFPKIVIES